MRNNSGRPVWWRPRRSRQHVQRGVRFRAHSHGVREQDQEGGQAYHGDWAQSQVHQQSGQACDPGKGVCPGQLPQVSDAGVRAQGGEDNDKQETKPHPQRGRLHCRLIRRSAQEQVSCIAFFKQYQ